MNSEAESPQYDSRPAGIGPGERLQAARIDKGLSVDDVASRMHLSISIIESIEKNRFDDITAPIFVKGYLRAYARIVSLDEEELIEQYGEYYSHEDPPIATTSNMAPELSVADVRIKWTTYLVILGLAALLAAWWWSKQEESVPISLDSQRGEEQIVQTDPVATGDGISDSPQSAEEPPPPDDGATASAELPPSAESVPVEPPTQSEPTAVEPIAVQPEPTEPVSGEATTAAPAVAEPAAPEPSEPVAATPEPAEPVAAAPEAVEAAGVESAASEPEVAEGEADASPDEVSSPTEPVAEAEQAPPVRLGAPVLIAPTGEDKLSIIVIADTWADIKDASDFQMVYHLLRADQSLELTGSAPFSVFLGNGHGVEIQFNGEAIDFSRRIRNDNTTRLSIGG